MGGCDIFLAKLSTAGNILWGRTIGRTNSDYAYSVAVEKVKSVYISGSHYSDTIVAGNEVVFMTPGKQNFLFIARYDESGNAQCVSALESDYMGNNGDIYIAVDTAGDVFAGGQFANEAMIVGPDTLTATNSVDLFTAKFRCHWIPNPVEEVENPDQLVVYPNPTGGLFTVSSATIPEEIAVFNAIGELVYRSTNCSAQTQIDLAFCAPGIYVIRVTGIAEVESYKLLIE
jgi:hypothetical protein